jgi:hypothetical protein
MLLATFASAGVCSLGVQGLDSSHQQQSSRRGDAYMQQFHFFYMFAISYMFIQLVALISNLVVLARADIATSA